MSVSGVDKSLPTVYLAPSDGSRVDEEPEAVKDSSSVFDAGVAETDGKKKKKITRGINVIR